MKIRNLLLASLIMLPLPSFAGLNYYLDFTNYSDVPANITAIGTPLCSQTVPDGTVMNNKEKNELLWATYQSGCADNHAQLILNVEVGSDSATITLDANASNDYPHCISYQADIANSGSYTITYISQGNHDNEHVTINICSAGDSKCNNDALNGGSCSGSWHL